MFVSIPREQSVYCENCDTVSVGPGEDKRCGVCLSEAILPLSKLIKFAAEPPVLLGLRVRSEMNDVAERREVGVLCFSHVLARDSNATLIDVDPTLDRELTVFKLLIEESGTSAESGVLLIGDDDDKAIIVAGVKPYCLAISGLPSAPSKFEPEYPLNRYARTPFQ